jgi:hypothetical protein
MVTQPELATTTPGMRANGFDTRAIFFPAARRIG